MGLYEDDGTSDGGEQPGLLSGTEEELEQIQEAYLEAEGEAEE